MDNQFSRLRSGRQAFCLIQKQDSDELLFLTGRSSRSRLLEDIPRRRGHSGGGRVYDTISIVPFCQIREKGCYAHDAGEEILTIEVTGQQWIATDAMDELSALAAQA
jgi:2-amino-4-deoxychorismate synthase